LPLWAVIQVLIPGSSWPTQSSGSDWLTSGSG
jgi:hypothetical protein